MRVFVQFRSARGLVAVLAIIAFALPGCGRAPTAPASRPQATNALPAKPSRADAAADAGLFYPLQLGNHWAYDFVFNVSVVPFSGSPSEFEVRERRERDLTCIEQLAGASYFIEKRSFPGGAYWLPYRQDRAGLYESDALALPCSGGTGRQKLDMDATATRSYEAAWSAVEAKIADPLKRAAYRAAWERIQARVAAIGRALGAEPASPRAAGGVGAGEITRLLYPLHTGARWVIRADPRFESVVEGNDVLDLPPGRLPAWRIRIDSELVGPDDRVHVWYGRSGYLMLVAHFKGEATDPNGIPIGTLISDESEVLTELSLGGGRFATP
jgi:hypothetical protein